MLQESGGVDLWEMSMLCRSTRLSFNQAQMPCFFNDNKMTNICEIFNLACSFLSEHALSVTKFLLATFLWAPYLQSFSEV
ncbi:unnamed protein product [Ixodes persulcatus]